MTLDEAKAYAKLCREWAEKELQRVKAEKAFLEQIVSRENAYAEFESIVAQAGEEE